MGRLIKTKFYCKGTSQSAPRGSSFSNLQWIDRFIEGKWYEGTYELWRDEPEDSEKNQEIFRLNNMGGSGWRRYTVINESGVEEEIPKAHMNAIFEMNKIQVRDIKIEQILKNKN